ncbi:MAG: hypothetical protein LW693_13035, partial [Saprospiraceae bacterium]|nr:hypothetical protein [Saprospiraceae bacterium]
QLNQQTKDADVSSIILKLQQAVDKMVVVVKGSDARDEDGILTQNFERSPFRAPIPPHFSSSSPKRSPAGAWFF